MIWTFVFADTPWTHFVAVVDHHILFNMVKLLIDWLPCLISNQIHRTFLTTFVLRATGAMARAQTRLFWFVLPICRYETCVNDVPPVFRLFVTCTDLSPSAWAGERHPSHQHGGDRPVGYRRCGTIWSRGWWWRLVGDCSGYGGDGVILLQVHVVVFNQHW